jgi:hypothetical protein
MNNVYNEHLEHFENSDELRSREFLCTPSARRREYFTTLDPRKHTLDKSGVLRFDFLFSYWVFLWAIAFYFIPNNNTHPFTTFIKRNVQPMFALYVALAENMALFIAVLYYNPQWELIIKFITMILVVKIIPLYLLRNYTFHWETNIVSFVCIFGLYNAYLFWNDTNMIEIYKKTIYSIITNQPNTPFFYWVEWMKQTEVINTYF